MWWNKYVGIPFVDRGLDESGLNCWGLVRLIYQKERGIELPSYDWCYKSINDKEAIAHMIKEERENRWHDVKTPQEFDCIILKVRNIPYHVGLVTKKNYMIHCLKDIGTVHVPYNSMAWKHRVMGFARYE